MPSELESDHYYDSFESSGPAQLPVDPSLESHSNPVNTNRRPNDVLGIQASRQSQPVTSDTRLPNPQFANSMIRKVVSSGNDALQILFEAAAQSEAMSPSDESSFQTPHAEIHARNENGAHRVSKLLIGNSPAIRPEARPSKTDQAIKTWNACRFVRMGLFTAEEAMFLVER